MVVRSQTPFGLGWTKRLLAFPRVPDTPCTPLTQIIFLPCCPFNGRRRQHAASLKSIDCLLSSYHPRLLVLFLMRSNVYPNPGPILPCLMCDENVTWRIRSVQCCTCSKWVYLRCSLLSFLDIKLSFLELFLLRPCFF